MSKITLFGIPESPDVHKVREFLTRQAVPFDWVEIASDDQCLKEFNLPKIKDVKFPVLRLHNGETLYNPEEKEIADKLGWNTRPRKKEYDLAIYGGGPAGLSAAVHAGFDGINTILIERHALGGQAGSSPLIENYLGFPKGISGAELADKAKEQALKLGVELCLLHEGVKAEFDHHYSYGILEDGVKVKAKASLCACGVEYRQLKIPQEEKFLGAGLFYGAGVSESPFCKDEIICVVGGGNGAGQAVLNFSRTAKKVYMIVRGENLSESLSQALIERVTNNDKIEVLFNTSVTALKGEKWLDQITIKNSKDDSTQEIETRYLFVLIGGVPHTNYFDGTAVLRDRAGYVVTGLDLYKNGELPESWTLKRPPFYLEASVPGLFAAGDVRHGSVKRYATAVGEGAMAVEFISRYLAENF